jgi:hypothetical protein
MLPIGYTILTLRIETDAHDLNVVVEVPFDAATDNLAAVDHVVHCDRPLETTTGIYLLAGLPSELTIRCPENLGQKNAWPRR